MLGPVECLQILEEGSSQYKAFRLGLSSSKHARLLLNIKYAHVAMLLSMSRRTITSDPPQVTSFLRGPPNGDA